MSRDQLILEIIRLADLIEKSRSDDTIYVIIPQGFKLIGPKQ